MSGDYTELLRAEILNWREDERSRVIARLAEQTELLVFRIEKKARTISVSDLIPRKAYWKKEIEPALKEFTEREYALAHESMAEALEASERSLLQVAGSDDWDALDATAAVGAAALTVAPAGAAAYVLMAGLYTAGGWFAAAALVPASVIAATAGVALFAAGPMIRGQAKTLVQGKWWAKTERRIWGAILSEVSTEERKSLLQVLLDEIDVITRRRLAAVEGE